MRIRIRESAIDGLYKALIVRTGYEGLIDRKYISKSKQKEVEMRGFAYINQPKERVL